MAIQRFPLIATKTFDFGGRTYATGELFEATPAEVLAHKYMGRAVEPKDLEKHALAPEPKPCTDDLSDEDVGDLGDVLEEIGDDDDPDAVDEPAPEPPPPPVKKKRKTYRRRDLQAEK